MKKKLIIIIVAGLFAMPLLAQHPSQDKNWAVKFEDSFSGTTLNSELWCKRHNIHGNELQHYIFNNVEVKNGTLILTTKKERYVCTGNGCGCRRVYDYTSGKISSIEKHHYGYYEIYAKVPASSGYFPAFWFWSSDETPPNCWYNEIDVFEAFGSKPNVVTNTIWYDFGCPIEEKPIGTTPRPCNYSTGYHWYGVEWSANKITWYIDRKIVHQMTNNVGGIGIQNPMWLIINVAISPKGCGNDITGSTIFPNSMYVDQANGYCLKCDKNRVINEIANFNTFYYAVKKSITLSGATTIPSNSKISLKATDFIELKNGFEVPIGAELTLDVTSCENTLSISGPNDPNTPYKGD